MRGSTRDKDLIGTIELFGYTITVRLMSKEVAAYSDAAGIWDHQAKTIFLHPGLDANEKHETLCHEIAEAIDSFCDLNLPHHAIQMIGLGFNQALYGLPYIKK
jgi:hypothetical protein